MRGSSRWLRPEMGTDNDSGNRCVRRVLDSVSRHTREHALHVQRCPTIASAPLKWAVRKTERVVDEFGSLCTRELTGENSPHTTNQPAKQKMDRVLVGSI